VGASPTGTASEAEYVEIGLTEPVPLARLVADLDAALPTGLDVLAAVEAQPGAPALADLINATRWLVRLPGVETGTLRAAVDKVLAEDSVIVQRATKNGSRPVDVRAALVSVGVAELRSGDHDRQPGPSADTSGAPCAILTAVVRQSTPAVRPDDVLGALRIVAGLGPPVPPMAVRLAQGLLDDRGCLADPFESGRVTTLADTSESATSGSLWSQDCCPPEMGEADES
jgi:radical SAM-linked protein